MAVTCWYLVVESLGKWWVDCEGKPFGPFDAEDEATEGAIRLATILGDDRRQLQVMAPDADGRFQIVWEKARVGDTAYPRPSIPAKPD